MVRRMCGLLSTTISSSETLMNRLVHAVTAPNSMSQFLKKRGLYVRLQDSANEYEVAPLSERLD